MGADGPSARRKVALVYPWRVSFPLPGLLLTQAGRSGHYRRPTQARQKPRWGQAQMGTRADAVGDADVTCPTESRRTPLHSHMPNLWIFYEKSPIWFIF